MDILTMQKTEANSEFSKFIIKNYPNWFGGEDGPTMSHNLFKNKLLPHLGDDQPTVVFLLDNLRFDQWKIIEPAVSSMFRVEEEDFFYSILPTCTQYSRNAIFAGMTPADIKKHYSSWWKDDIDEGGKNLFESQLLDSQLNRLLRKKIESHYVKVTNVAAARQLNEDVLNYLQNDLTVVVYNFIDMLSHARTEMEVLKELASDERAYRSLTLSWFKNSPLSSALEKLRDKKVKVFITTDHGTIRVHRPSKVVGDKNTTTNLRYKMGRNLNYDRKDVLEISDPHTVGLPKTNISSRYIFAKEDRFFLYPNNYNRYNKLYNNTFQHGGISLEEIVCPFVRLSPK